MRKVLRQLLPKRRDSRLRALQGLPPEAGFFESVHVRLGFAVFLIFSGLLLTLELFIRMHVFLYTETLEFLIDPALYASYYSDDDFWKLLHIMSGGSSFPPKSRRHQILGWTEGDISDVNPLGLRAEALTRLADARPKIFYFSDSGATAHPESSIPTLLTKRFPEHSVVDFGTVGYGPDQMLLQFRLSPQLEQYPISVFSMLTESLDRVALTIRNSTKPHFDRDKGGEFQLHAPYLLPEEGEGFLTPQITSYLFRLISRKISGSGNYRGFLPLSTGDERKERVPLKKDIMEKIFSDMNSTCSTYHCRPIIVMQCRKADLSDKPWHEEFLEKTLPAYDIPFLNSKTVLLSRIDQGVPIDQLFDENGALTPAANQAVGEALADFISETINTPLSGENTASS